MNDTTNIVEQTEFGAVRGHISGEMKFITSAKEVMFLPDFVCLFVCLSVSKITQKVMDGFF